MSADQVRWVTIGASTPRVEMRSRLKTVPSRRRRRRGRRSRWRPWRRHRRSWRSGRSAGLAAEKTAPGRTAPRRPRSPARSRASARGVRRRRCRARCRGRRTGRELLGDEAPATKPEVSDRRPRPPAHDRAPGDGPQRSDRYRSRQQRPGGPGGRQQEGEHGEPAGSGGRRKVAASSRCRRRAWPPVVSRRRRTTRPSRPLRGSAVPDERSGRRTMALRRTRAASAGRRGHPATAAASKAIGVWSSRASMRWSWTMTSLVIESTSARAVVRSTSVTRPASTTTGGASAAGRGR